ncbi:MAG: ligase-associated DNA damage response endonuclease PdeM [Cyanobium sp.]
MIPSSRQHRPAIGASSASFPWREEHLELLAEGGIHLPDRGLVLVADLHLGKAESFQCQGIPLPSDGDATTLNALLALVHRLRPAGVIVLGDLIHSPSGLTADLRDKLRALPDLMECPLRLIGGNHDRGSWLGDLPSEPSQACGALWLSHAPEPRSGKLNVCGHLHPVALVGRGNDRLRLPCFSYSPRSERLTLPAFGALTGGMPLPEHERQWLLADGVIVEWAPPQTGRGTA